ncbi:hypothetical protein KNP414_06021 [Paenibacillus mucilaginosus KNP414]|uniref:Uncharacterized protein n=1 Tax=Paenibacillus mucilaginosus (strain KNP414) TaxID=1036673 RepID=F8FEE6_PAEMK|nr:hypothetical protein KNP414_06021 [Paenibacillus mucilaginosus KNP414]
MDISYVGRGRREVKSEWLAGHRRKRFTHAHRPIAGAGRRR